jgi:hypothetical protein
MNRAAGQKSDERVTAFVDERHEKPNRIHQVIGVRNKPQSNRQNSRRDQ